MNIQDVLITIIIMMHAWLYTVIATTLNHINAQCNTYVLMSIWWVASYIYIYVASYMYDSIHRIHMQLIKFKLLLPTEVKSVQNDI